MSTLSATRAADPAIRPAANSATNMLAFMARTKRSTRRLIPVASEFVDLAPFGGTAFVHLAKMVTGTLQGHAWSRDCLQDRVRCDAAPDMYKIPYRGS